MEQRKNKHIFIKSVFAVIIIFGICAYAYYFPKTMELFDKEASKLIKEKEITFFSDFSKLTHTILNDILYLIEIIEENTDKNSFDTSPLPVAIITNAAFFPSEGKRITSDFGERVNPISKTGEKHLGIDIAAPQGSSVFAAWPGKIAETGFDDINGNFVTIEHSKNFYTKYCHLSKISCDEGDFISAKEKIGEAGSTGWATGNHLHFEVIIEGKNIDPKGCFEI